MRGHKRIESGAVYDVDEGYRCWITTAPNSVIREQYHENPGKGAIENIPLIG